MGVKGPTIAGFIADNYRTIVPRGKGGKTMIYVFYKLYARLYFLIGSEEGQDLVEYALVVALIAFGATAGMKALAGGITKAFEQVSTTLGSYVI
jgi:pilus assembly protein Flp/PilA